MEAKSHDLPSEIWKCRKASGVIPAGVWRPENCVNLQCKSQSKGRRRPVSKLRQAGGKDPVFFRFLFYSGFQLIA